MTNNRLQQAYKIVFSQQNAIDKETKTTVIVPLYNYQGTIVQALDSVAKQTIQTISLIVVDDCSTDNSQAICEAWMGKNHHRFSQIILVSHAVNSGLSSARNTGFSLADSRYGFTLDADNILFPRCVQRCELAMQRPETAFVYPMLASFGGDQSLLNTQLWNRSRLLRGNYIDAMALIRKSAWQRVGGYASFEYGWEDFDLWCSFAEQGWHGVRVPEILAGYRVHHGSMLQSKTNRTGALRATARALKRRHPWLKLQH